MPVGGPAGAYVFEVALPEFAAEVALAALDEYSGKLAYVRGSPPASIR